MARTRHGAWRRAAVPLAFVLVFSGIAGGSYLALEHYGSPERSGTCTASGLGTTHRYRSDQTANAALISAVAVDRDLPPRAASIALATAYQESQLRNIDHGDRDSLGLFQQRPSQGWGTAQEIMDPIHAANAFYDRLVQIEGYESGDINAIAQRVQRSGVPEGYRDHETEGRLFASALTGMSGPNLTCSLPSVHTTVSPEAVRGELSRQFPRSTEAGRITTQLQRTARVAPEAPRAAGPTALTIEVDQQQLGWAIANWSVARAASDGIVQVRYAGRVWDRSTRGQDAATWSEAAGGEADQVVILLAGS